MLNGSILHYPNMSVLNKIQADKGVPLGKPSTRPKTLDTYPRLKKMIELTATTNANQPKDPWKRQATHLQQIQNGC